MTSTTHPAPADLDFYFQAVLAQCGERGIAIQRLGTTSTKGYLGVELQGSNQSWALEVDCGNNSVTRLPHVNLLENRKLRAHVGYSGGVCVSDNQGLSLDPERRPDIIAYTVLLAYELLEKWDGDPQANIVEFYNELEGYWLGLPGTMRARAAFEVDGSDRLISFYLGTKGQVKWHFTERNVEPPREFEVKGLAVQRALYLNLDSLVPPPVSPAKLDASYVDAIRQRMSPQQLELWTKLIRPSTSKNHPKRVALLLSIPRVAGGLSLIGIAFGTRDGRIDTSAEVTPLTIRRHTPTYMRERGGASLEMYDKHVVVLGCGAVGSVVADALAATGVGQLTLVDYDDYSEDNVFRHIIEPIWIDYPKVYGLKFQLERHYPGIKVNPVCSSGTEWFKTASFENIDAVVFAFGLPTLERSFNRAIRKVKRRLPLLFTWLEPLDLGGHSIAVWSEGGGCLDCLYRDDEGVPTLYGRMSFLEPNQAVSKNLTGCASVFVPYGALQARKTGLMAAEHILETLINGRGPTYHYWVGAGEVAGAQGLQATQWWADAPSTAPAEATRRIFGRPCKRCRDET